MDNALINRSTGPHWCCEASTVRSSEEEEARSAAAAVRRLWVRLALSWLTVFMVMGSGRRWSNVLLNRASRFSSRRRCRSGVPREPEGELDR